MNLIDTVWFNALGAFLFLAVILTVLWCVRDARREAAHVQEPSRAAKPSLKRQGSVMILSVEGQPMSGHR